MPWNIHPLKQLDQRAKSGKMTAEDGQLLRTLIEAHRELVNLLKDPGTSLDDLYQHLSRDENDTASVAPQGCSCDDKNQNKNQESSS